MIPISVNFSNYSIQKRYNPKNTDGIAEGVFIPHGFFQNKSVVSDARIAFRPFFRFDVVEITDKDTKKRQHEIFS